MIRTELREGIHQGIDYLASIGHRRIGFVAEVLTGAYHQDLLQGYRDGLIAHSLPAPPEYVQASGRILEGGTEPTERLLALPEPPTAIVVSDYRVACGVARIVERAGLDIGRDMSILTMAGKHEHGFQRELTRITDDIDQTVQLGLKALLDQIADPGFPTLRLSVPCSLQPGETVGPPPVAR